MKIKNINENETLTFINNAKCLKQIKWKIENLGYIDVALYLVNKEFWIIKHEFTKFKTKSETFIYKKKIEAQTYIRGLRRNIKKYYKNFEIEEEFQYSEEGDI